MEQVFDNIRLSKSIAEIIMEKPMPRWKKWALRKLIPQDLWEAPPIKIGELQKGGILTGMRVIVDTLDTSTTPVGTFNIGN